MYMYMYMYMYIYIYIYIYIYVYIYIYILPLGRTPCVWTLPSRSKAARVFLRIRNRDSIMPPLLRPVCFRGRSTAAVSIVSLFRLPLSASFLPRDCHPRRTREYPALQQVMSRSDEAGRVVEQVARTTV